MDLAFCSIMHKTEEVKTMKPLCRVCTPGPGCSLFDAGSCPKQHEAPAPTKSSKKVKIPEPATEPEQDITVDPELLSVEPTGEGE